MLIEARTFAAGHVNRGKNFVMLIQVQGHVNRGKNFAGQSC